MSKAKTNNHIESLKKICDFLEKNPAKIETPGYLYDIDQVMKNYRLLKEKLGTSLIVSLKANSCFDLLVRYQHMINDLEVASLLELNISVQTNKNIYVNTPAGDEKLIRAALASKATIIIDNLNQLDIIAKYIKSSVNKKVILRLNSSVINQFSPEKLALAPDYFGMDWDNLIEAIKRIKALEIDLTGIHVFHGPFSFAKNAFITVKAICAITEQIETIYGKQLTFINLGGGFSDNWQNDNFDFAAYREQLKIIPRRIEVAHESGRGIFSSCGYYLIKVIHVKELNNNIIAICDGGLSQNFLLAQTENIFREYKIPYRYHKEDKTKNIKDTNCTKLILTGSTCSRNDVLSILPANSEIPEVGDIYIFDNCGAYNYSYSVSKFLSLPEAKQYLIS